MARGDEGETKVKTYKMRIIIVVFQKFGHVQCKDGA